MCFINQVFIKEYMMNTQENLEEFEALPLRYAYKFLAENGLENEALEIKQSRDKYKSFTSTLKRGKITALLTKSNLLGSFIDSYWPFGKSESGKRKISRYERIYSSFLGNTKVDEEQEEEEEVNKEETSFALEEHLRDYISKNLSAIESGLKLWKDKDDIEGIEYPVDEDNRRIDILAIDKNGIPVVIELKVSRGYQKVIGQCLYYKNRVKQLLNSTKARIIIIAREISPELKTATQELQDVKLLEYKLSFSLQQITL
jgi:hypothetical protein